MTSPKTPPKKKSIWARIGEAVAELIGNAIYQGPR